MEVSHLSSSPKVQAEMNVTETDYKAKFCEWVSPIVASIIEQKASDPQKIFKAVCLNEEGQSDMVKPYVEEAAEKGDKIALFLMGRHYYWSEPNPKNKELRNSFFWLSARQDYAPAHYYLGLVFDKTNTAFSYYKKAVDLNFEGPHKHGEAYYHLAECYENGWGTEKNLKEAEKYYKMAAEKGHASAEDRLDTHFKTA